jgi:predicted GTPase
MYQKIKIETEKIVEESQKLLKELIDKEKKNKNNIEKKTLSLKNLNTYRDTLKNELQKLKNLEYVIAIMGTMKSGKSMTINAIVGQEILPSREFPMTTLPTLITHDPNKTEPSINIKKIEPFNLLKKEIKSKLNNDSSVLSSLGEIRELGEKIKNDEIEFKTDYQGQKNISQFLKEINDLMRIAKELDLEPPYAEYTDVDDLPRIKVEFYHLKKHNQKASDDAKLTLLDTPGPDEVKQSKLLQKIFDEQLHRASAVTLIVDYTKMNNESDADVKEQVKGVAERLGKKHLFVLLNKFDQRNQDKDEAESYEEAKRLIYDDILKDKINKNNVYPISSKSAFYANRGLCELDKNGRIDTHLPWRKSFGVEVLGRRWEKYINNNKEIIEACNEVWKDSFFEKPLNNIISSIHNDASLMALDSPLNKMEVMLEDLFNALNTQENAYEKDIQELRNRVIEVENSVKILQNIIEKIYTITNNKIVKSKKKLGDNIDLFIKDLTFEIKKFIQDGIDEKEEQNKKENLRHPRKTDSDYMSRFLYENIFGGRKQKKTYKKYFDTLRKNGEIPFDKKDDADSFIKIIIQVVDTKIINLYEISEKEFNNNVLNLSKDLNRLIRDELNKIIQEISKKLGDEVFISLPTITIKNKKINSTLSTENFIKEEKESYTVVGDSWWQSIGNWINYDWGKVTKYKNIFKVTQNNIMEIIKAQVGNHEKYLIEHIEKRYKEEISKPIKEQIFLLLKKLDGYKGEQLSVLEKREISEIDDLNNERITVNEKKKRTKKLINRVIETKKQMKPKVK